MDELADAGGIGYGLPRQLRPSGLPAPLSQADGFAVARHLVSVGLSD
jgi:hypothetical protein